MPDRDEAGRFLPGNGAWSERFRTSTGTKRKFENGDALLEACKDYFEWAHQNPIVVDNVGWFQGRATHEPEYKTRPLTVEGLAVHLGISPRTWRAWSEEGSRDFREDLAPVIEEVEAAMYSHNFDGASAGLFNAGIIARKLGLSDKQELTGKDGGPVQTEEVSARERLAGKLARIAAGSAENEDTGESE